MRQPSIGRLIALLTGATVVLLLTIDTTMACRFFLRHRHFSHARPVASCAAPCDVVITDSVSCGQPVYESGPVYSDCCGEVVTEGTIVEGHVIEATPAYTEVVPSEPAPLEPTPAVAPDTAEADDWNEVPESDEPTEPAPDVAEEAPADDGFVEPAIVEEPADDVFDAPAEDELPADELPADDLPADDFFDEPAADTPDTQPADDVFGQPADELPADVPADEMPADDLDVFDQPADEAVEPDDLFGAPADQPAGDVFDQPAPLDQETDLPGFDEPVPADQPTDGDQSDSLDDLFGATTTTDAEPRTAAVESGPTGDLFDAGDTPLEEAAPAADDLFDTPAEEPAQDGNSTVDDLDDLFGAAPAPSKTESAPVTQPVQQTAEELPVRVWTDNTGRYHTVGRLVKVSPTHVRLLKDNGRFSTVPKRRLSEADLSYVEEVTEQLGVEYFDQVARR